jgi:hypothetical protein
MIYGHEGNDVGKDYRDAAVILVLSDQLKFRCRHADLHKSPLEVLTEGYDHFGVWPQLRKAAKKLACGSYFWDGNEVLIKPMLMSTQNYSFGRHRKCLKTIVSSLRSGRELLCSNWRAPHWACTLWACTS